MTQEFGVVKDCVQNLKKETIGKAEISNRSQVSTTGQVTANNDGEHDANDRDDENSGDLDTDNDNLSSLGDLDHRDCSDRRQRRSGDEDS